VHFLGLNFITVFLNCDIPFVLDAIRWYRADSRNTTNNVVQYLLLRLNVSALPLGYHQVSKFASVC